MRSITLTNINKIYRISNTFRRGKLKDIDLNPALHMYISYVCRHEGCKQEEIIDHFFLDKTTVTHQLNHLEKYGFITREVSKEDGRCRLIYPTEKAKEIFPILHQAFQQFTDRALEGLTEQEKELLDSLTNKIVSNGEKLIKEI